MGNAEEEVGPSLVICRRGRNFSRCNCRLIAEQDLP
jgi:hypothetical protein